ncbi:MAG: hypothetical protein WCT49_06025 [Candidatus Paceibacterota bacterium]|jgi:hypothetical protein|nr:hypothetical protein [Candidatus Paceibacterota bacterium]
MKKETKEKIVVEITPEIRALFDSYHKETEKEMTRYVGALSEDFQSKVSAIGEQFSGLNDKLDMHTEMIGLLAEDVAVLKEDVSVLKDDVGILKTDVSEIKDILKTKADKTEVIHISRRVSVLERNV